MIKPEYKYSDLTEKIIGFSMAVHSTYGNGFQEVVYQRCLEIEFEDAGICYQRELEMALKYKGRDVGTRRVDFLVDEKVMVELKAVSEIEDVHIAQALNYLEAYQLEVGLLINFGARRLQVRRLINERKNKRLNR